MENGQVVMDDQSIGDTLPNFFHSQFFAKPTNQHYLNFIVVNTLSDDQYSFLHNPISNLEILNAVQQIGSWKSLGPDGFQARFYKHYWDTVGGDIQVLIHKLLNGQYPRTK